MDRVRQVARTTPPQTGGLRPVSTTSPLARSLLQNMMDAAEQTPAPKPAARIGDLLLRDGAVDGAGLAAALASQSESQARLGDILIATGAADRLAVLKAAALQFGLPLADLAAIPKTTIAAGTDDIDAFFRHGVLALDTQDGDPVFAAADPRAAAALAPRARLVIADERALRHRMVAQYSGPLALRAAARRPEATSLRRGAARWQRIAAIGALAAAAALTFSAPGAALTGFLWAATGVIGLNTVLWLSALIAAPLRNGRPEAAALDDDAAQSPALETPAGAPPRLSAYRALPRVSVLAPLYREAEMAAHLVAALARLDYPPELLDVKVILEADDEETAAAIAAAEPPPFIDVLTAPPGAPRTKPRALNFALDFVKGDIIGVYDAEDRPPPDQIRRIVAQFAAAPPEVACVQARLGYYNTAENWLTRCFEIEYASWFDTMLPGLRRLGMPLPLGGTSLFIRRGALDAVGGWDSHNVTEDADLGMMLARAGLRTALSASLTEEEASSRPGAWIHQRSRWLKGYLATWTTHMRRPLTLWRDLGTIGFLGFNATLLSAVTGYLILPALWLFAAFGPALVEGRPAAAAALATLGVTTTAALPILLAAALRGLQRRGAMRLWPWLLTLPLYWALGAAAAYLAVWELVAAPTKWRKTRHGVGRIASSLNPVRDRDARS